MRTLLSDLHGSKEERKKKKKKKEKKEESYMGTCLSSSSGTEIIGDLIQSATAKVITLDGHLLEYSGDMKAYEVLGRSHPSCFLCSSDDLDCDAPIPPLGSQESLERGQLYFILPVGSLRGPLMGRDMAALAVRASLALADAAEKSLTHEPWVARVLPVDETDRFHGTSAKHLTIRRRKEMGGGEIHGPGTLQSKVGLGHHPGTC